jgi:hypothetical protein
MDLNIQAGHYTITAAVHSNDNHLDYCSHWLDNAATFKVAGFVGNRSIGIAKLYPTIISKRQPSEKHTTNTIFQAIIQQNIINHSKKVFCIFPITKTQANITKRQRLHISPTTNQLQNKKPLLRLHKTRSPKPQKKLQRLIYDNLHRHLKF